MKYLLTLLLSAIVITSLKAQNAADKQFIRDAIKMKGILYTDRADAGAEEMKNLLNKDTIKTLFKDTVFVITKQERVFINKELANMHLFRWADGLLDSSKMVEAKTLRKIFSKKEDTLGTNWRYFHTHYGDSYFTFSKPIFLRNNTFCIFRFETSCDWTLCGHGEIDIYKKVKDKWVAWYPLKGWQY